MASNQMHVCVSCRTGNKSGGNCTTCREPMVCLGRVTIPKKNNDRAWKRIAKGEVAWNRRRSRYKRTYGYSPRKRAKGRDTITRFQTTRTPVESDGPFNLYRVERVPGSEREVTNFCRKPDVDLGG